MSYIEINKNIINNLSGILNNTSEELVLRKSALYHLSEISKSIIKLETDKQTNEMKNLNKNFKQIHKRFNDIEDMIFEFMDGEVENDDEDEEEDEDEDDDEDCDCCDCCITIEIEFSEKNDIGSLDKNLHLYKLYNFLKNNTDNFESENGRKFFIENLSFWNKYSSLMENVFKELKHKKSHSNHVLKEVLDELVNRVLKEQNKDLMKKVLEELELKNKTVLIDEDPFKDIFVKFLKNIKQELSYNFENQEFEHLNINEPEYVKLEDSFNDELESEQLLKDSIEKIIEEDNISIHSEGTVDELEQIEHTKPSSNSYDDDFVWSWKWGWEKKNV